jgi:hypothetical protein
MEKKPRRRRDAGDICQLRVEMWAGIRAAAGLLEDPDLPPEVKLRAISALATAGSVYLKLLSEVEFGERLSALERAAEARKPL